MEFAYKFIVLYILLQGSLKRSMDSTYLFRFEQSKQKKFNQSTYWHISSQSTI